MKYKECGVSFLRAVKSCLIGGGWVRESSVEEVFSALSSEGGKGLDK